MADSPFTTIQPIFSLSTNHNTSSFLPFSAPPPNPNSNSMHEQFLLNYSRWWTKMCLRRTVRKNKATSSRVVGAVWGRSIRALPSSSFCDVTSAVQFRAHNLICKEPQNIHQIKHLLALDRIINPLNLRTESILTSSKQKHNVGEITLTSWICLGRHC